MCIGELSPQPTFCIGGGERGAMTIIEAITCIATSELCWTHALLPGLCWTHIMLLGYIGLMLCIMAHENKKVKLSLVSLEIMLIIMGPFFLFL